MNRWRPRHLRVPMWCGSRRDGIRRLIMGETTINGLHLACAFCGFAVGLILGAVMGYQWRKEVAR